MNSQENPEEDKSVEVLETNLNPSCETNYDVGSEKKEDNKETNTSISYLNQNINDAYSKNELEEIDITEPSKKLKSEEFSDGNLEFGGKILYPSDVLNIFNEYKKDTMNFFVGKVTGNCSTRARKVFDNWYPWTEEMMDRIKTNEIKRKEILDHFSHAKVQTICKKAGGMMWNSSFDEKEGMLLSELREFKARLSSSNGIETSWGKMKFSNPFQGNYNNYKQFIKNHTKKQEIDVVDYVAYMKERWNVIFKQAREKEDERDLYTHFW